jgi:hypothetical protein
MTMFIQLEDGKPVGHAVTEDNFRLLFPGTNFSWPFVAEDVEPLGFGLYDFSSQPELGVFEKVVEVDPVKDEYGRWRQTWAVEPMNEEEVAARTEQEWGEVRSKRNFLLVRSDWTQLEDTPLTATKKQEWASYRQALRDIPTQSDPFNIVWPISPGTGNL